MGPGSEEHDTLPAAAVTTDDTLSARGGDRIDLSRLPTGDARYVVGALLGKGGMGDVILATDAQIGRDVAVKRMRDPDGGSVARFLREARIQARLDHPAIVPVHEVCVDGEGRPYFVMKRLTGTTLYDILGNRGHVSLDTSSIDKHPLSRLLRAFSDVCLAVEFAHTRGVVHRDLKPSNIMLGDFGEVYVLDWGVARVMAEDANDSLESALPSSEPGATEAGAILGTPGYMPPEQLRGTPVDRRADVYALGCILFEILAGSPLHTPGVVSAVLDDYDARPSTRAPSRDVPPELELLVVRATDPDPAKRPKTAREMSERVNRYLDGDRDLALRRRLAREQVVLARAALIGEVTGTMQTSRVQRVAPTEAQRRTVMQLAARALALDPTSQDAAEIVGRMMLEPASETPAEVVAELDAIDDINLGSQARIASGAFVLYAIFVPIMYVIGMREPVPLATMAVAAAINAVGAYILVARKERIPTWYMYVLIVGNTVLIGILSWIFSEFMVTPALAVGTILGFSMHPRFGRPIVLAAIVTLGAVSSWLLDLAGVATRHVTYEAGAIVLQSPAGPYSMRGFEAAHTAFIFALTFTVGLLAREMWRTQRAAREAAHMHAWHLRQLVPIAPKSP